MKKVFLILSVVLFTNINGQSQILIPKLKGYKLGMSKDNFSTVPNVKSIDFSFNSDTLLSFGVSNVFDSINNTLDIVALMATEYKSKNKVGFNFYKQSFPKILDTIIGYYGMYDSYKEKDTEIVASWYLDGIIIENRFMFFDKKDFYYIAISFEKEKQINDFRNSKWGDNKEKIRSTEKLELDYELDNALVYKDRLLGLDCKVAYIFIDDKLVRAKFIFTEDHTNENEYLNDYVVVKDIFIKKYNKPFYDKEIWNNSLYKNKPEKHGFAMSLGYLEYITLWNMQETEIVMLMNGDNLKIEFAIEYSSKKYDQIEERKSESKALDKI